MLANNKLIIFSKNAYILKIDLTGILESVDKLPSAMNTHPIIIDNTLLYVNNSNKLVSVN